MKHLVIDTSSERSVLGLIEGNTLVHEDLLEFGLKSSESLLPTLAKILSTFSLKVSELDSIILGTGPGSYTGMRVGAAIAQSISYAKKIPLLTLSSLYAFSPKENGNFAVVIDAKVSGLYLITGKKENNIVSFEGQASIISYKDLSSKLPNSTTLVSPNFRRIRPLIEKHSPNAKYTWEESAPSTKSLHSFAKEYAIQKNTHSPIQLLYLRLTQAEIEKKQALTSSERKD